MGIIKCAFSIWTGALKPFRNICHHHKMLGSKRNGNGCLWKTPESVNMNTILFSICKLEWADGPNTVFENSQNLYNNVQLEHPPHFQKRTNRKDIVPFVEKWRTVIALKKDQTFPTRPEVAFIPLTRKSNISFLSWPFTSPGNKQTNEKAP